MYHLWERNDGHIGATQNGGRGPQDYVTGQGKPITFKVFAVFEKWDQKDVEARIEAWKAAKASVAPVVSPEQAIKEM